MFNYVFIGFISFSVLLVTVLAATNDNQIQTATSYSANEILGEITNKEAIVLDVRTRVEYDLGHVDGSENFNVELLKNGVLPEIEKDERVYVYCRSGNRSEQAKQILMQSGFLNVIDLGGLPDWGAIGGVLVESELADYRDILAEMSQTPITALGPENADITIVKYSDFQCPYCAKYSLETEPEILSTYVDVENPRVRYEFRNAPFQGSESVLAAEAGYCANEQKLFWPFHDLVNVNYGQTGPDILTLENLVIILGALGGDKDEFTNCITSEKYSAVVSSEALDAKKNGIESTPTIFVGEQRINGALPFSSFKPIIDAQI